MKGPKPRTQGDLWPVCGMRLHQPFSDGACVNNPSMKGLKRVVLASAIGGLLSAVLFFAVDPDINRLCI